MESGVALRGVRRSAGVGSVCAVCGTGEVSIKKYSVKVKFKHIPVTTSGRIGGSGGGGNKGGNGNSDEVELHFDGLFWGGELLFV